VLEIIKGVAGQNSLAVRGIKILGLVLILGRLCKFLLMLCLNVNLTVHYYYQTSG